MTIPINQNSGSIPPPLDPTTTEALAPPPPEIGASAGVTVDPATVQKLETDITTLMAQVQAVMANISALDSPPPAEPGEEGHVNKMLLAQFPTIAFAMMELARNLMEMSFSMSQFSIKLTGITYDLGVQMGNLQEALTKAQMKATQGDIIKDCIGIGAGFAMIASGPMMRSRIENRYAKQNEELELQKAPLTAKMTRIDDQLNPGSMGQGVTVKKDPLTSLNSNLAKTNTQIDDVNLQLSNPKLSTSQRTTLENQKADLVSQKTTIEKDIKYETDMQTRDTKISDLNSKINANKKIIDDDVANGNTPYQSTVNQWKSDMAERDQLVLDKNKALTNEKTSTQKQLNEIDAKQKALGDAKQNELSMIGPNVQIGSQMLTQIGNVVGAAMTLASQLATIAPAKAMKVLEQVQTLLGNMLQTMQSNRGDYESMLNSLLQQFNGWVGALSAIKYSRQ